MSKIENAGKFIAAGDTVFRVQENYGSSNFMVVTR